MRWGRFRGLEFAPVLVVNPGAFRASGRAWNRFSDRQGGQLRRQRGLQLDGLAGGRVRKAQAPGVQEHAFEAVLLQGAVQGEVAVFVVTRNGVAAAGQVHADLVGAAGFDKT